MAWESYDVVAWRTIAMLRLLPPTSAAMVWRDPEGWHSKMLPAKPKHWQTTAHSELRQYAMGDEWQRVACTLVYLFVRTASQHQGGGVVCGPFFNYQRDFSEEVAKLRRRRETREQRGLGSTVV